MKTIITLFAALLMLGSLNAHAHHQQQTDYRHDRQPQAFRCYDVDDRLIEGIWNQRDASLVKRVGGSCAARGPDEGDLHLLKQQSLTQRDIKKALRKARRKFPQLLQNTWLIGAYEVNASSLKHVKYTLIYSDISSGEHIKIKIKVKQNLWSGKVKRMRAVSLPGKHPHYDLS